MATHPYQEGLWELLITALYRAGRQADALAAYQRVRTRLADELGLDPGPQLQELEQQILDQDPALRAAATRPAAAGNLPSMSAELIGRDDEIAALSELLAGRRLVEIVGPGGIGKTAVAIATGRALSAPCPGGVWLARLETARDGGRRHRHGDRRAATSPAARRHCSSGSRRAAALVILDNCEHVLDAAAALAVRLLDAAPGLRILCTSQVPLDVDGEAVFELAPLALSDAVELFTRAAPAPRAATRATTRARPVPLARRSAAGDRARRGTDQDAVDRGDHPPPRRPLQRAERPDQPQAGAPPGARSTIRWSYELLFPDDQRGLWALATFAGGAPLAAVESVLEALDVPAVGGDRRGRAAREPLARHRRRRRTSDAVRYRLLDSIRAFALEAMADAGLTERALAAHAAWFAAAAGVVHAGCAQRPPGRAPRLRPRRARQHRRRAGLERGARPAARARHRQRVRLGLGRARRQPRRAADPGRARRGRRRPPRPRTGPAPCCSRRGSRRRRVTSTSPATTSPPPPSWPTRSTTSTCRRAAATTSPTSSRTTASSAHALELTDRSNALYDGLDRPWDQAANWLFAARAAISAGDRERASRRATRSSTGCARVDDPWLHVRREAMLGELARARAPLRRCRPAPRSGRGDVRTARLPADRGVPALQPRTRAVPGRRLRDRRGHPGARDRQGRGHR